MAKSVLLKANARSLAGRSNVKKIRAQGRVPGVLYGKRTKATNLEIVSRELERVIHHASSENILVDLEVEQEGSSSKKLALIQDIQHDPLSGSILHVDFHEIAADEKFRTQVPIEAIGEAVGVKTYGGILEHILRDATVECVPKDLPEKITVDVSNLNVGQNLHISDLPKMEGVTILNALDVVVFAVAAPAVEEEKPATEAEQTQPEVIKEKKPAEGAEAAEEPAAKKEKK